MNFPYLVPRVVRHFLPERLARFLLLRSLIIRPGLETADPAAAIQRYESVLAARKELLLHKRVLVFGYGGRFDIGVGLLDAGADFVILCDRYALPDDHHNITLMDRYGKYLQLSAGKATPRPERMVLLQADVREVENPPESQRVDLIISNSVYEHLDDAQGVTAALVRLTRSGGLHIHFVDLRDHYFKYPFEMLTYSDATWKGWLNPSTNHNRLRLRDYRRIFRRCFRNVEIEVLRRDEVAYRRVASRIRPEFASGNLLEDSATLVQILASEPLD